MQTRSFTQQGYYRVSMERRPGAFYGTSPWGPVDHAETITDGIIRVSTASHGGIGLSYCRYASMNLAYQIHGSFLVIPRYEWIWFEEDCEVALVYESYLHEINEWRKKRSSTLLDRDSVEQMVANYYPEAYEVRFGRNLQPGESVTRDRELFYQEHAHDLVVVSAFSGKRYAVPDGMVGFKATYGGLRSEEEHCFLIPADEYASRDIAFVVDPTRHTPWASGYINAWAL